MFSTFQLGIKVRPSLPYSWVFHSKVARFC